MEIYISNAAGKPIYQQITDQIRAAILSGKLREGEALPSIRLLARELQISVITTKRAYEDPRARGPDRNAAGQRELCRGEERRTAARSGAQARGGRLGTGD